MATKLKDKLKKATQSATRAANEAARKTAQKTGVKEKQNNSTPIRNVQSKTKAKVDKAKTAAKEQNRTPKNKGTSKPVKRVQNIAEQSKYGQKAKADQKKAQQALDKDRYVRDQTARAAVTQDNIAKGRNLPKKSSGVLKEYGMEKYKSGLSPSNLDQTVKAYDLKSKNYGLGKDKVSATDIINAGTLDPLSQLKADSMSKANFGRWANPPPSKKKTDKELVQDATKKLKQATHKKGAKQQKTSIYDQSLGKQWENEIKLNKQSWDAADALYKAALRRGDEKAAEKYAKQRDEAHEQAETWRRIKGGFSGGASGDEYIRPKLDTKDKNLLNKEGEKRLAAAKLGYENAKTDAEKAMYAAMGQSIRNNPKYNLKKGREQRGETYDPGAYREFDANGRMRYAGTKEERKKEQEQTLAIPKTIGYTVAGAFASIPGTTARALREDAYNNQGYLQNLSDIRGGGEVKISEPEKKKTPQERLQELYRDDYFINASPVLKAKKLARVIKAIHDDIPVGQRLLAKGEQYHKIATEGQSGLERYLTEAIIMAGEMAPGLLATGLSGGAAAPGLITMGAQAAGQTMGSLESQGVNPVEAFERGALSGFIEAGTELIPLRHLLKMGKGEGKSFAKELITQLIEEVGTEEASEILGFAVDEYYEKPNLTAEALWNDIQNSLLPSMKDTAAITALTTLGMGTGAGAIGSMRKRVDAQDLTTPTVEDLAKQREALEAEKAQWEMVNARLLDRLQNNTDDPRVHKFFLQELQEHEAKKKELEAKEAGLTMQEMARNEIEAQKQELEQAEQKQGQDTSKPEAKPKTTIGEFKEKLDNVIFGEASKTTAPIDAIEEYIQNAKNPEEANLLNRLVEAYKGVDYAEWEYDYAEGESVHWATEKLKAAKENYKAVAKEVEEWEQTRPQQPQDQAQPVQQEPQPQQQAGSNPLLDAIGKRFGAEDQTQAQAEPQTNPAEVLQQSAQPQTQEQEQTETGKYKPGLDWNDAQVKTFSAKVANELDTIAKKLGVHIRFANLNEDVDTFDPEPVYNEGYIEDGVITLSRDIERPVEYVLGHEITHRMQELAPEEYGVLKDYVKGLGKYQDMVDAKIDEYRRGGETLDEEEAWDEITADFAGDIIGSEELMSDFIRGVSHEPTLLQKIKEFFQDLAAKLTGQRKVQVQKAIRMIDNALGKSAEAVQNGDINENAAQKGDAKRRHLIKALKDGRKYVQADREVIFGNDPRSWGEQAENYINGKIRKGENVPVLTEDGDILLLTKNTAEKAAFPFHPSGKRMTEEEYLRKLNAAVHIDELAKISQRGKQDKTDFDGLHGEFAKDGWNYRTVFFQDFDGQYYKLKVSVAKGKDGNIVYNVGDISNRSPLDISGSSAQGGALGEGASRFGKSINENTQNINGQAEQNQESEAVEKVGVEIYDENNSATRRIFSKRTYEQSDYVQDREKAAKVLAKNLKVSVKKAKKYIDDINTIAAKIGEDRLRLDYEPNPYLGKPGKKGFDSSLVSNAEYGGSIDFSTICKKRRLYTGTIEAIQKAFPNKALTADEMLTIRNMMKERGYEVACGMCYVEGSRAKFGEYAQQFVDELKKEEASRIPNIAEINTIDGLKRIRAEEPELYKKYTDFINSLSQRKLKLFMSDTEYNGEILAFEGKKDKKTGESMIQKYNDNGGFRLQSFSDFEIIHLIDAMQVIMDMSRVGLKGQAYTKVADFAKALGNTGLKINLSMVAKGLDENGRLVFDEVEGMKESEALELRDKHPDNVGTVVVCFTADQIRAALMDDRVDFVLPFHHSQWSAEQFEAMGLPEGTRSFQSFQNDYPKEGKKENLKPLTFWNFNKDGRWNAEKYLKICHKEGRTPKFAKFHGNDYLLVKNDDGSYSLPDGPIGDNYWKLLIDVKMYNHLTGKGAKPKVVSPEFDMEEANRMLEDYTGGHETLPVAQDIVDEFTEMENTKAHLRNGGQLGAGGTISSGPRFSKRMRQDYSDAAKAKDTQTASKIVREAAAQAGYTVPVYHGTQQFGFTVPEGSKGDDGISFFVTGDIDTARTYSDSEGVRQISDKRSSPESRRQLANDARFEAADGIVKLSRKLDEMSKDLFNPTTMLIMMSEDIENASDRDEAEGVVEDYFDSLLEHLYNRLEGNEDNAPDDLEFDWLLDEGNEITNQFRKEFEDARQLFYSLAQTTWSGEDYGNYNLFLDPTGLLEVNGDGKQWWGIPFEPIGIASTREIAKWAKDHDYTGVHFKGIVDDGGKGIERSGPADVYAIFSPEYQTKSADPFTYDDKGNLIPLEERFDPNNPDWRWSKRKLGDNSMHESIYGKKKLPRRKQKRPKRTESDRQGPYSVGAAPSGFDRFSQWQNQSSSFHPINPMAEGAEDINWGRAPVEIPTKDLYGKLTSKTASTFANAGMTPNQVSDELANMAADGRLSRIPFKDKTAVAHAEKVIQDKGYQRAKELWQRDMDHGNMGKNVTVMGITLYNAAANSGHITEAIDIATDMIGYAKTVAQSLQAVNIINKLGPTGKLYSLTRSIEKLEEQIRRKKKLDPEHWSGITIPEDLAKAYMDAKTLEEQREIEVEIKKAIAKQIPNTLKDKFDAWRYTAMLGNPRTQVRNILGNMGFQPLRITKNAIGAGLERMAGIDQSQRTKAVQFKAFSKDDKARYQAGLDEYEDVQDIIMGNGKFNDDFSDIDQYRTIFKFKPFEKWRELTNWGLEKGDIFFAKRTYADSLAGVLKARGITAEQYQSNGFDQHEKEAIQAIAIDEAQKATYRDLNQFSKYVAGLGKKQDTAAEKVAHYLTEGLLPFKKTPANILVRGLEYSPLGLIKGVVDMGTKVKNGEITAAQGIDEIASGLTGTGMLALGVALGLSGIVSPGDDEDDKQNKFNELIGKQSYALNLPGGYSFTLDWLAPESIPFFMGVELQNAAREVEEGSAGSDLAWNALRRMADPVLEQSMLQGVTDMLENVSYADNKAASILTTLATGYLSQFVPTIGGQLERTLEDRRYSTWIDRNSKIPSEIQYLLAKNLNKIPIPGVEYNQRERLNAWGEPEMSGNLAVRALTNFLSPGYLKKETGGEVEAELQRLYDLGFDNVFPTIEKTTSKINGEPVSMEQFQLLQASKGQLAKELYSDAIGSAEYEALSDADKADYLSNLQKYAKTMGEQAAGENPEKVPKWMQKINQAAEDHDVGVSALLRASMTIDSKYDADGNGSVKTEEAFAGVQDMAKNGLSENEQRAIFDMYNGTKKTYDEYKAEADKKAEVQANIDKYISTLPQDMQTSLMEAADGKLGGLSQADAYDAIMNLGGTYEQQKAAYEGIQAARGDNFWKDKGKPRSFDSFMKAQKKASEKREKTKSTWGDAPQEHVDAFKEALAANKQSYHGFFDACTQSGIPRSEWPSAYAEAQNSRTNKFSKNFEQAYYHVYGEKWKG